MLTEIPLAYLRRLQWFKTPEALKRLRDEVETRLASIEALPTDLLIGIAFGARSVGNSGTTRYLPCGFVDAIAGTVPIWRRFNRATSLDRIGYAAAQPGSGAGSCVITLVRDVGGVVTATALTLTIAPTDLDEVLVVAPPILFAAGERIAMQTAVSTPFQSPTNIMITVS